MRHLAAYTLLVVGGNAAPTVEQVTTLITSIGGEVDEEKLTQLFADLEGKDLAELLALGEEKLKVCSAAGPAAAAPAAGGAAPAAAAVAEKPKEEEVDALEGGMDMFGGGGAKTGDY
jgi:large subunit ribosomal protein LP2